VGGRITLSMLWVVKSLLNVQLQVAMILGRCALAGSIKQRANARTYSADMYLLGRKACKSVQKLSWAIV
jgi:hypothetical protein